VIDSLLTPLLTGALAALVSAAPADSAARPVRTLAPIEVAAERVRLDARRRMPAGAVSEVAAGANNRALETAGELLQSTVGARVVTYGGLGAFSTLSLRGAAPGQVSVFLDGVPLTSAAHGVVNLADLPLSAVDRLEVYRGSAPLGFGAATPGGAVNLVSTDAPQVRTLRLAAGSFGTVTGTGTLGGTRGAFALLANAGYEGSNGNYRYWTDNDTPFNLDDDHAALRINNRYDASHALTRLAWRPDALLHATLRAEGFHKAQGIPGRGAGQAPNPRLTLDRSLVALEAGRAPAAGWPGLTLRAHAQGERSMFRDSTGELHLGRQDGTSHVNDRGAGTELSTPAAWRWVTAAAGAELREESARPLPPTLGQRNPAGSRRTTRSAQVTLQLHAPGERLVLQAGRRWDRQRDRVRATLVGGVAYADEAGRTLNAPQLGARARLPFGLEPRASWSRASRAPEFSELFGDQAVVAANPKLLPERGENWDAGLAWGASGRVGSAGLEYAHFASHVRDLIGWQPAPARTVRATNYSRVEIAGDELSGHAAWRMLAVSGSATWTDARQTDPAVIYFGRRLPLRPGRQAAARFDARLGAWRLSADLLDLGEDFLDPINFQRLAPRTLVGVAISRAIAAARLTLECKNLGDARVSDLAGYPIPGRSLFVACELRGRPDAAPRP
jgi:iron complex outermembrane receptor protein